MLIYLSGFKFDPNAQSAMGARESGQYDGYECRIPLMLEELKELLEAAFDQVADGERSG